MTMMIRPTALIYVDDARKVLPRGNYRSFCVCRTFDKFVENVQQMIKDYDIDVSFDSSMAVECAQWLIDNHIHIYHFDMHESCSEARKMMIQNGYKEFHY